MVCTGAHIFKLDNIRAVAVPLAVDILLFAPEIFE
jgi:hypothetical protein